MRFLFNFVRDNKTTLLKYGTIGASSTIVDFGLYVIFTDALHIFYIWSAALSFIIAALFNFIANRHWTFQSNGSKRKQLPVFFLISTSGVVINIGIIAFFVEVFGLWDIYAKIIATGMVTIWNFLWNKYITFRIK